MENIKMIDLPLEHKDYEDQLIPKISQSISKGVYINGEEVKQFTESLKSYINSKFCIPCGNGTDALQIALMALELKPGDEILIPSFNYVSSAEVTLLLGLTPVFVDANINTYNISVDDLEKKITPNSKVILATHLFGQASEMKAIMDIAKKHHLKVIEDNAQSLGCMSEVNGILQFGGTIGDIGTTSFFPTKNLGGFGDGGAIFTNDDQLASKMKSIASHGQSKKYYFNRIGINSRLDTIQAVGLNIKLNYLDDRLEKRIQIASRYLNELNKASITLPKTHSSCNHTYNQFTIQSSRRDEIADYLKLKGIPTMIYYHLALHQQSAYQKDNQESLPNAEKLAETVLSLPVHPMLSDEQQTYIINTLNKFA